MDSGVAAPWPWPGGIKHRRRPGSPSVFLGGPDVLPLADLRLALVDVVHRRIGAVAGGSRWIAASRPMFLVCGIEYLRYQERRLRRLAASMSR